jgi:hypothetical protein
MCTEYTLSELRRHWLLYSEFSKLSKEKILSYRNAFFDTRTKDGGLLLSSARSAGPLAIQAVDVLSKHFTKYSESGLCITRARDASRATLMNPTFIYSLAGDSSSAHYGSDPLVSFHHAPLFGNSKGTVSIADTIQNAKSEFASWCTDTSTAFSEEEDRVRVRFFLGEANSACYALKLHSKGLLSRIRVPVSPWKTELITFDNTSYARKEAPFTFDVIDTSNLVDHIGLLNIMISVVPMLASHGDGIIYTESLLPLGEDATKAFATKLHGDLTTMSMILGVCPVDYLCGFSSRSNMHELFMHNIVNKHKNEEAMRQFHQVTTWRVPAATHSFPQKDLLPPLFHEVQLGTLLYDIYHSLFESEDAGHFAHSLNKPQQLMNALAISNIVHYTREGFVKLLRLVRERMQISEESWYTIMERFLSLQSEDRSPMKMDSVNSNDLWAQLHYQGVYTLSHMKHPYPHVGRFKKWKHIPPIVRLILVIPRENVFALNEEVERIGNTTLHCDIRGKSTHNIFTSVHASFGTVIASDDEANPSVRYVTDPRGWTGASSIIASWLIPTHVITDWEPMEDLIASISIRNTPLNSTLIFQLGPWLNLYSASLMDTSKVHILPEDPIAVEGANQWAPSTPSGDFPPSVESDMLAVGHVERSIVELDEECEMVSTLTCRLSVESDSAKTFIQQQGNIPIVTQVSPCHLEITLGGHSQVIPFIFPIIGGKNRLRIARKSLYIEVGHCFQFDHLTNLAQNFRLLHQSPVHSSQRACPSTHSQFPPIPPLCSPAAFIVLISILSRISIPKRSLRISINGSIRTSAHRCLLESVGCVRVSKWGHSRPSKIQSIVSSFGSWAYRAERRDVYLVFVTHLPETAIRFFL